MTAEQYREYLKTGRVPASDSAVRAANVERDSACEPMAADKTEKTNPGRYRVSVHCRRARATDSDGVSIKSCVDGIVQSGLLPDDSRDYIPQTPLYTEQYTKEKDKRKTTIVIERVA